MATDYWISNVGGVECVGAPIPFMRDVYSGLEYVDPNDNDLDDNDYSHLADIDILGWEGLTAETVGCNDLWDDSEVGLSLNKLIKTRVAAAKKSGARLIKPGHWQIGDGKCSKGNKLVTIRVSQLPGASYLLGPKAKPTDKVTLCQKKGHLRSVGGDVIHTLNTVTRLPQKAIGATLGKIPGVGGAFVAASKLSPSYALGGLASKVAAGERIDKAFLSTAKSQIKAAREVAPYVQTVMSVVPGVGTGVAAAIAAGTALAEGRTITDSILRSVKGALPGGPLAAGAFDAAVAIAGGQRLDKAAINAAKGQLPPAAQTAVDAALRLASGKNAKDVVLQALSKQIPNGPAKDAYDIGIAMAAGRNIQSAVVNKVASKAGVETLLKHGERIVKASPWAKRSTHGLTRQRKAGAQVALGAMSMSGLTAHALAAAREKLPAAQRQGFDHVTKAMTDHTQPNRHSLVTGGKVLRGNWRPAKPNTPGATRGRVVRGKKVELGYFVRGSDIEAKQLKKLASLSEADKVKLRQYAASQRNQLAKLATLSEKDKAALRRMASNQ